MYIYLETIQEQDICRCRWCELSLLPKAYFLRLNAVCLSVGRPGEADRKDTRIWL